MQMMLAYTNKHLYGWAAGGSFVSCRRSYLRLYRIHFRYAPEKPEVDLRSIRILQKIENPLLIMGME